MRKTHLLFLFLGLDIMGCSHNIKAGAVTDQILNKYQSVLETLHEQDKKDSHLCCEYFLYDITGDSIPELWIKVGTCEADTKLLAFTCDNSSALKIYEGDGGHSDFFIYDGQLVCVMCNTGAGVVITYEYDGKRVIDSMVEFSTWNDEGNALSEPHDSIADKKLRYWQENYGNFIKLKPL